MYKKILCFILFFLYVANIQFVFLPDKMRTRLIISVIGFIYYISRFKASDIYRIVDVVKMIIPLAIWMGFSIVANSSTQIWFLQYVVLQILFMFGAVFVIHFGKLYKITTLLWFFVIYILTQDIIAFSGLQMPTIYSLLDSIQVSELSESRRQIIETRAFGFGEFAVFGGGVWIAIGLLCMTLLYKLKEMSTYVYILLFMLLLGTGLFVARTSLTGLLSVVILLFPINKNKKKMFFLVIWGGVFLFFLQFQESYFESIGLNTNYAFEIFNKYGETGHIQSNSYNATREMWKTLPTEASTWLIGDAMYEDKAGGYYMHTDVGYLRVIFYGGLVGLFLYLLYIFKLTNLSYLRSGNNQELKFFLYTYYVLVLIWMWKGHFDTNIFLYLWLFSSTLKQKTRVV